MYVKAKTWVSLHATPCLFHLGFLGYAIATRQPLICVGFYACKFIWGLTIKEKTDSQPVVDTIFLAACLLYTNEDHTTIALLLNGVVTFLSKIQLSGE